MEKEELFKMWQDQMMRKSKKELKRQIEIKLDQIQMVVNARIIEIQELHQIIADRQHPGRIKRDKK